MQNLIVLKMRRKLNSVYFYHLLIFICFLGLNLMKTKYSPEGLRVVFARYPMSIAPIRSNAGLVASVSDSIRGLNTSNIDLESYYSDLK
jgi:hypothetical protein